MSLGALASGELRVVAGEVASGFFAGWTRPFALACGLFAQGLFAFLAATYLTVDTEADAALQEDFRRRALASGLALAPAAALTFALARNGAPRIFERLTSWWAPLLLGVTSVFAVAALLALWSRRFPWARAMAIGQVTCILIGWGVAQHPYIVVPDLTLTNTATAPSTLRWLAWALAAGAVVLFPSFAYLLHVFKGTVSPSGPRT